MVWEWKERTAWSLIHDSGARDSKSYYLATLRAGGTGNPGVRHITVRIEARRDAYLI